jgi:hypothetical protein
MAMAAAFQRLQEQLKKLHDAVSALYVTVTEDKPTSGTVALIDPIEEAVDDMLGAADEAVALADQALQAARISGGSETTRQALGRMHQLVNRLERIFWERLAKPKVILELRSLARERGGGWQGWVKAAQQAIDDCARPLLNLSEQLLDCWEELSERIVWTAASMRPPNSKATIDRGIES